MLLLTGVTIGLLKGGDAGEGYTGPPPVEPEIRGSEVASVVPFTAGRDAHEPMPGRSASVDRGPRLPSQPDTADSRGASETNRAPVRQTPVSGSPNEPTTVKKAQQQRESSAPVQDKAEQNPVVQRAKQSIAYVKGKKGSGTGFVVRRGIIATNSHVIGDEYVEDLRVQFLSIDRPDSQELKVTLLYEDRNRDLALLALDDPHESPAPLEVAEIRELPKGWPIVVIGNPIKINRGTQEVNHVSEGTVDSLVVIRKQTWYHLKAAVAHGNSGGPVLDARSARVLGILTLGDSDDPLPDRDRIEDAPRQARPRVGRSQNTVNPQRRNSFCIPCQFLREAVRKIEDPDEPQKSPKEVGACHLAEMVVWNIDRLHSLYQAVAKKEVEYLRAGRLDLVVELNRHVVEKHDRIMKSLDPAIRVVRSDRALSDAVRQRVQNLLDNYNQVKKQTERTSARNEVKYRELLYKLSQNHASYLKQLSKELVVPEKD